MRETKTHCRHGHEIAVLGLGPSGECYACRREADRRRSVKRSAARAERRLFGRRPPPAECSLTPAQQAEVRVLWETCPEITAEAIGARFSVTKNVVIGLSYRRGWSQRRPGKHTNTLGRLAALHAMMDVELRACGAAP